MKNPTSKQSVKKFCVVSLLLAMCVHLFLVSDYAAAEETSQDENPWKVETTMPTPKRGCSKIFEKNGKIYMFGGIKEKASSDAAIDNKVDIYDTATKKWSTGADLPESYNHSNIALAGNKIYVMGGQKVEAEKVYSDVYVYDIANNSWDSASPMPVPCSAAGTVTIGDKIYVIDGYYGSSNDSLERVVQIYDTKTDSWSTQTIPASVQEQSLAACHVYKGKIYIIGGRYYTTKYTSLDIVNIYDPVDNSWSTGENMPVKASGCASVIRDDNIYIIGGNHQTSDSELTRSDEVYIYNITKNTWSQGAALSSARVGSAAVLVKDKIYLFGGIEGNDGAPMDKVEVLDLKPEKMMLRILMNEGENQQLSIHFNLEDNKKYQWISSDDSVVTVNESGVATAIHEGEAEVTVKSEDGSYEEIIGIKVTSMRKLAAHIQVGGTVQLYLVEDPSTVAWKSADEAIATVDETGVVTGIKKGLVAITAELDGEKYELYVRVAEKK